MKTIKQAIIGAVALLFASAVHTFAIEGLHVAVQCSNVVLSWDNIPREEGSGAESHIEFDINMQRKQVVGAFLDSTNFWRPDPQVGMKSELESDYQKRISGKTFVRTNF